MEQKQGFETQISSQDPQLIIGNPTISTNTFIGNISFATAST